MQSLCKTSRKVWQTNEDILIRIIKNKRVIPVSHLNEDIMQLISLDSLKYFRLEADDVEEFLASLLRTKLRRHSVNDSD